MTVRIYSTPSCIYCKKAKEFLDKKSVYYEEINVVRDRQTLDNFIKKTGQKSVPVIEIGSKIMLGYNEEEIDKALSANG